MITIDPELQAKIDKIDQMSRNIGNDLFGALSQIAILDDIFPTQKDGNKRTGEQDSQSEPEVQKEQAGPNTETGSTDPVN